ncbi:hypothetical protein KSS87_011468, partial [Heliosperma pusillum]
YIDLQNSKLITHYLQCFRNLTSNDQITKQDGKNNTVPTALPIAQAQRTLIDHLSGWNWNYSFGM